MRAGFRRMPRPENLSQRTKGVDRFLVGDAAGGLELRRPALRSRMRGEFDRQGILSPPEAGRKFRPDGVQPGRQFNRKIRPINCYSICYDRLHEGSILAQALPQNVRLQ